MPQGKHVFMVDKWETSSDKHEVTWAVDGDLNKAAIHYSGTKATKKYGCRKFSTQRVAIAYAKKAGLGLGEGTKIGLDLPTGYKTFVVTGGKVIQKGRR
jgi:hypothetical protein